MKPSPGAPHDSLPSPQHPDSSLSSHGFPAGTLVLTREHGYRPIERVILDSHEGDVEVLTHLGRWRRVAASTPTRFEQPVVTVHSDAHPGLEAAAQHLFFVRTSPMLSLDLSPADGAWVPAEALCARHWLASPIHFPAEGTPEPVPDLTEAPHLFSPDFFWLLGHYLASGYSQSWTDPRFGVELTTHPEPEAALEAGPGALEVGQRLTRWTASLGELGMALPLSTSMRWHGGMSFEVRHKGLSQWVRHYFGTSSRDGCIPGWVLGMSAELRQALLDGYLAHARPEEKGWGPPFSRSLHLGLRALAGSLGEATLMRWEERWRGPSPKLASSIEHRWLHAWEAHMARLGAGQRKPRGYLAWSAAESAEPTDKERRVYGLSVEEDDSYVVEGLVVRAAPYPWAPSKRGGT